VPETPVVSAESGVAPSARLSSRERILAATVQVALREGVSAMTLDAVAKEAGVSKGGLLYHFASKDDLIAAMLERHAARIQKTVEARMAADPNPRGRWFRSLVQTIHGCPGDDPVLPEMPRFLIAMLAASATNPRLLDPIRERLKGVREQLLAEGPNGMRQVALWPAIFGLMLWRHLGILGDDDPVRQSIVEELLGLAEGETHGDGGDG
jgi:AcrR family transcriptional regulator